MADAYTQFLNLTKPEVGASRDAWGDKWNVNANLLDAWAKGVNDLATAALSRTAVNKDANGATIPWGVAGPVAFAAAVSVGGALNVGAAGAFVGNVSARDGTFSRDATTGVIYLGSDGTRNLLMSKDAFQINGSASLFLNDKTVWHAGNFTPAEYARKASVDKQVFSGAVSIQMANPYFELVYPGVMNSQQAVDANGTWILRNGGSGDNFFYVTTGGGVWTKEFGGLNARIEARAAYFADDRLNSAKAYTNSYAVAKTGDTMTGDLTINKGYPSVVFNYPGVRQFTWQVRENGRMYLMDITGGSAGIFSIGPALGDIAIAQFGDLNTRIEARAANFADDRLATARAEYGQKVAKTGDTMTGALIITSSAPFLDLVRVGNFRARQVIDGANNWLFQNGDNGDNLFYFNTGGAVWTKQFGDLNNRIEARGAAFADDRLNTATARVNNKSARLAFLADRNIGSQSRGMEEPYSGGVVTGAAQNNGQGYVTDIRYRQLQMSDSNGSWYACGYV